MVWDELTEQPRGRLGRDRRARRRRAAHAGRRRDGAPARRRRPHRGRRAGRARARCRGSAGSRSSSGSSCRRSRSSRSAARCAGSCSAPRSRRPSARSTTSAACAGGRSSRGQVLAAVDPVHVRRLGPPLHLPDRRRARAAGVDRDPADDRRDRRGDEHGQLPRRARRPRGRRLRDLGVLVLPDRAVARPSRRGDPDRDRLRRVPRLPPAQLLSGADLHGRLRRAAARLHARGGRRCRGCSRRPP